MSFPRYPDYRDSKTPWFGNIPVSWQVYPFKLFIDRNDGGVWGDEPTGISDTMVLRSTEQTIDGFWKIDDPAFRQLSFNEKQNSVLDYGDLLITKSSGSSLHIGKTTLVTKELAKLKCCYSNFTQRIRLNSEFCPKFAWYLFNNAIVRSQFDLLSNSTTGLANLTSTMIGQITVPVAPINEQLSIINFLDQETTKIDALIAEQEKLIELLKEKRQAVISHAVTKGLDPNVKMKNSGVEWLGQVPAHWEIKPLKVITSINDEVIPETTDPDFEICYVDIGSVSVTDGIKRTEQFKFSDAPSRARRIVRKGDIIVSTVRTYLKAITSIKKTISNMIVSTGFAVIRPKSNFLSDFASYSMQSGNFIDEVISRSTGVSYPAINASELGLIKVALPPIDEQAEISFFLIEKINAFDRLNVEANAAILILQERRSALISAAVTGQIDVRNVAITKEAA